MTDRYFHKLPPNFWLADPLAARLFSHRSESFTLYIWLIWIDCSQIRAEDTTNSNDTQVTANYIRDNEEDDDNNNINNNVTLPFKAMLETDIHAVSANWSKITQGRRQRFLFANCHDKKYTTNKKMMNSFLFKSFIINFLIARILSTYIIYLYLFFSNF